MKTLNDAILIAKRLAASTGITHYVIRCKGGAFDPIDAPTLQERRKKGEKIITLAEVKGSLK